MMKTAPKYLKVSGMNYQQALEKGFLREGLISKEQAAEIEAGLIEPQAHIYGLRNIPGETPEQRAKRDYMRLEKTEEDEAFLKEQQRKTLTMKEMKKLPREVLQDGWDEDMKIYSHKRKE